ncbi:hypothetical protein N7462_004473 [Penicillium macrosclerotiorum]|uniref:uncharacterized protein n=1 Tax=Penicillium macrosclerotiorum TaxID=303699 RepID=UPI0025479CFF|nr:uncharacterized protein N7462_004473 [Penicillium macrosclerotiorum]KAJ5690081.1 hypothetical protein N7462_004473 [Penicillium macrosclerotiorum]
MDLSLHNLGHTATEAERRAWWSAPQPWPLLLESEESIISVSSTLNDCLVNPPNNALPSDLSENIMQLDSHLSMLLKRSAPPPQPTSKTGPDAMAARSMRLISSLLIHS